MEQVRTLSKKQRASLKENFPFLFFTFIKMNKNKNFGQNGKNKIFAVFIKSQNEWNKMNLRQDSNASSKIG